MLDGGGFPKHSDVLQYFHTQQQPEEPSGSVFISQVSLLVVMEIGLFPLICGWWLDICSLVSSDKTVDAHQVSRETLCPSFRIVPFPRLYW